MEWLIVIGHTISHQPSAISHDARASYMNTDRVYMLAADHRWQWEDWCDERQIPRARIGDAKRVAYDGFLRARDRSPEVREFGALLLDAQYAAPVLADALAAGVAVGTPAEKAGAFPLAWAADPFDRALTGAFVKVLVRYRPDDDEAIREGQWQKVDALQTWCRSAGRPLVVEILVPRRGEAEDEFEAVGRPGVLAGFIREAYRRELTPQFWKIEGTVSPAGARTIDAAIAANGACRQIILGKAAELSTIGRWFKAAAASPTASGFAIGRSVFWEPSAAFLSGAKAADRAAADIADNYLQLVDAWRQSRV
jgi:myo-inositol catabolism protein IolC